MTAVANGVAAGGARRLARGAFNRIAGALFGTVVSVRTQAQVAALTFDDGPDPVHTPQVLDVLRRHGARATFFMVGAQAARHPGLVARIAAEGHEIGNHSWDHPSLPLLGGAAVTDQLRRAQAALGPHGGALMRPPYGHQNLATFLRARRLGLRVVAWSVLGGDWRDDPSDAIARRVQDGLAPGAIILLHDNLYTFADDRHRDRSPTIGAVEIVLRAAAGYRFVTVSELLRQGRPSRRWWAPPPDRAMLAAVRRADPA